MLLFKNNKERRWHFLSCTLQEINVFKTVLGKNGACMNLAIIGLFYE